MEKTRARADAMLAAAVRVCCGEMYDKNECMTCPVAVVFLAFSLALWYVQLQLQEFEMCFEGVSDSFKKRMTFEQL